MLNIRIFSMKARKKLELKVCFMKSAAVFRFNGIDGGDVYDIITFCDDLK